MTSAIDHHPRTPSAPRPPATFVGAVLPVCDVDVLIVAVRPWILADPHEATLYVAAFALRFQRTIVLMAQDAQRVPTYYGPAAIVLALRALPFELIPWRRIPYRAARRHPWRLPVPPAPPPYDSAASWGRAARSRDHATPELPLDDVPRRESPTVFARRPR